MLKKRQTNFFEPYISICCSLICFCYLIGALQVPVLRLMHGISHLMEDHSTEHHHDPSAHKHAFLEYELQQISQDQHSHTHSLLSWFKQFLEYSDTNESTPQKPSNNLIDKHLISQSCKPNYFFSKTSYCEI